MKPKRMLVILSVAVLVLTLFTGAAIAQDGVNPDNGIFVPSFDTQDVLVEDLIAEDIEGNIDTTPFGEPEVDHASTQDPDQFQGSIDSTPFAEADVEDFKNEDTGLDDAPLIQAESVEADPNRYIIVFKNRLQPGGKLFDGMPLSEGEMVLQARESAVAMVAQSIETRGGLVHHTFAETFMGVAATLAPEMIKEMKDDPNVDYIEPDQLMSIGGLQKGVPWGLDRLDERTRRFNDSYMYYANGDGVSVYVVDSGIHRSHREFGGRALHGADFVGDGWGSWDCKGHGTHVAGIIGGSTYGVAKKAKLYSVRVLNCGGSAYTSDVIKGVDWVTQNHQKPAVANMSLGGGASRSLDRAVRRSINAGVTYVLAAGNENKDACSRSPARTTEGITVGATTSGDRRANYSNYGNCLDIFAPGHSIWSAWNNSDTQLMALSGTSMAAPHVTGVAALYLQHQKDASPNEVRNAIAGNATMNKLSNIGQGSPNSLLYALVPVRSCLKPLYRYWNSRIGDHFYTTNWEELRSGAGGWRYERTVGFVARNNSCQASGAKPLYRYWNSRIGDHFYTTNWAELRGGRYGWRYEGRVGYVLGHHNGAYKTRPLYRYWHNGIGDHFYTDNWGELRGGRGGWRYEGRVGYAFLP